MDNQITNYKKYLFLVLIVGITAHGGLYYLYNNTKNKNEFQSKISLNIKEESKSNLVCRNHIESIIWDDKIKIYKNRSSGDMRVEITGLNTKKYNFIVKDVNVESIDTFVPANCHFYTTKFLNVIRKSESLAYDASLWQYTYTGEGKKIIDFTKRIDENNSDFIYNLAYSVDPKEKFLALSYGYVYGGEMSLIIKDIDSLQDLVVIDLKNTIFKNHPEMLGDVSFENAQWSDDKIYFLVPFSVQAGITGYVRVNLKDGTYQVYDSYPGTMGGDQINVNTGWTTFDDGPEWSGWKQIEEEVRDQWRKEGMKVNFGIYNIYTKEKRIIEQVDDTTHWHEPRWIDDNTLEYVGITGEKKIYNIFNQ